MDDPINARQIINGNDQDMEIAELHYLYLSAALGAARQTIAGHNETPTPTNHGKGTGATRWVFREAWCRCSCAWQGPTKGFRR